LESMISKHYRLSFDGLSVVVLREALMSIYDDGTLFNMFKK